MSRRRSILCRPYRVLDRAIHKQGVECTTRYPKHGQRLFETTKWHEVTCHNCLMRFQIRTLY